MIWTHTLRNESNKEHKIVGALWRCYRDDWLFWNNRASIHHLYHLCSEAGRRSIIVSMELCMRQKQCVFWTKLDNETKDVNNPLVLVPKHAGMMERRCASIVTGRWKPAEAWQGTLVQQWTMMGWNRNNYQGKIKNLKVNNLDKHCPKLFFLRFVRATGRERQWNNSSFFSIPQWIYLPSAWLNTIKPYES